jgi:hypothetical protein
MRSDRWNSRMEALPSSIVPSHHPLRFLRCRHSFDRSNSSSQAMMHPQGWLPQQMFFFSRSTFRTNLASQSVIRHTRHGLTQHQNQPASTGFTCRTQIGRHASRPTVSDPRISSTSTNNTLLSPGSSNPPNSNGRRKSNRRK